MNMAAHSSTAVRSSSLSGFDYEILSVLPMGCAIFEANGTCSYLNPMGQALLGCSQFRWKSLRFYQLGSNSSDASVRYSKDRLPVSRALMGETVKVNDLMIVRQENEVILEMQAVPIWQNDDRCAIVTFQDTTAQHQEKLRLQEQANSCRSLIKTMPASFQYRMSPDGKGRLTDISPHFYATYDVNTEWLLADPENLWALVVPETREAMRAEMIRSYETMTPWIHEGCFTTSSGPKWFQGYAIPEKLSNGDIVWYGFVIDITAQREAKRAQEASENQLRYLTETCLGATFRYFVKPDGFSGFSYLDEQIQNLYGLDRDQLLEDAHLVETIAHPEDRHVLQNLLKQALNQTQPIDIEYRIITPEGQIKWTKVYAHSELQDNGDWIWNGTILDITERKQVQTILEDYNRTLEQNVSERTLELEMEIQERKRAEISAKRAELALRQANQKLESLATLDGLTQIANRRRFDEFLQHTWRMTMREGREMSVILCDVDYFKNYNDTYGHQAGDACLQQIAMALQQTVQRSGDLVARYGGEEFVIILANTDAEGAASLAERLKRTIAALKIPHSTSDVSSYVTISMGVCSMVPTLTVLPESLVSCADKSLYLAKHYGRNCIVSDLDVTQRLDTPSI